MDQGTAELVRPEWFYRYCGMSWEAASREGARLIKRAHETGNWHEILERLIFLRGQMIYLKSA